MITIDEYRWFVEQKLDQFAGVIQELDDEQVNRRPELPGANSPYGMVSHCLGVTRWWIGHFVGGREVQRNRDGEFIATGTVAELLDQIAVVRASLPAELEGVRPEASLRIPNPNEVGTPLELQGGALVHVYEELAQHLGQLELTRDLLLSA